MKILLANHHLRDLGGSETFTYAIYEELKRRGHEVKVFTLEHGIVSDRMRNDMIPIMTHKERPIHIWPDDDKFELAIVMHNTCLEACKDKAEKTVFICNSTSEELEQPVPGADEYIAISEEVQEHLKKRGFDSRVVRNGIDLKRFRPLPDLDKFFPDYEQEDIPIPTASNMFSYPKELKVVLQISNKPDTKAIVKKACDKLGLDYITVGLPLLSVWNVERLIWAADLIVSIGRGAYEAMACGRPVIVLGVHGMEGLVKAENVEAMRWYNCSGRWRNQACNEDTVMNALLEAKNYYFNEKRLRERLHLDEYRTIVEEHFDIRKTVDQLLKE